MTNSETTDKATLRLAVCCAILRSIYYNETVAIKAPLSMVMRVARSSGDEFSARDRYHNVIDVVGYTHLFPGIESEWRLLLLPSTR